MVTNLCKSLIFVAFSMVAVSLNAQTITIASSTSDTICATTTVTFTATPTGVGTAHYQWLKNSVHVGTDASTYVPTGLVTGDVIMCELLSAPAGSILALSGPKVMTVDNIPVVAPITGTSTVCLSSTRTLSDATPGGVWSSSHPLIASVSSGGIVTGGSVGTDSITYTLTNTCGSASAAMVVSVITAPALPAITGPAAICNGSTATFTDSVAGGVWGISTPSIATISSTGVVTALMTGTDTVFYVSSNACGTTRRRRPFNVVVAPVAAPIAGVHAICQNDTVHLSDTYTGGTWITSNPAVGNFLPPAASGILRGNAGGTVTITYRVTNACGADSVTASVTVNPLPFAYPIFGSKDSVCQGGVISLTELTPGGIWSSKNTGYATVDAAGNVTGVGAGVDTIFYSVSNDCGTNIQAFPVYVYCPANVGVVPVNTQQEVKVYPNPATNVLHVDGVEPAEIEIVNIYGQVVASSAKSNQVMLAGLPAGMYVVIVRDEHGAVAVRKSIIKQ